MRHQRMTPFTVAVLIVCLLAGGFAQQRPQPPETFRANATVEFVGGRGFGSMVRDFDAGRAYSYLTACEQDYSGNVLRNDNGKSYVIFRVGPASACIPSPIPQGKLQAIWQWVPQSKYRDTQMFHEQLVDVWSLSIPTTNELIELGVQSSNTNRPVFLSIAVPDIDYTVIFDTFETTAIPPESFFAVPPICNTTTSSLKVAQHPPSLFFRPLFEAMEHLKDK